MPGITQVTASLARRYLRKNWPHVDASNSAAHAGTGLPRTARNSIVQGSEAICHSKMLERHVLPGQVVIGSDSHTPHSGAVGCVAFGVGTTAIFNSWLTKDVRLKVPPSVLIRVNGQKPVNVTAKDFMLQILRHPYVKSGRAIGKIVEYAGDAVRALSIDERASSGAWTPVLWPLRGVIPLTAFMLFLQGISEVMKSLWAARTGEMLVHHEKIEV